MKQDNTITVTPEQLLLPEGIGAWAQPVTLGGETTHAYEATCPSNLMVYTCLITQTKAGETVVDFTLEPNWERITIREAADIDKTINEVESLAEWLHKVRKITTAIIAALGSKGVVYDL